MKATCKIYLVGTAFNLTPSFVVSSQTSIFLDVSSIPFKVGSRLNGVSSSIDKSEKSNAKGDDFQIYWFRVCKMVITMKIRLRRTNVPGNISHGHLTCTYDTTVQAVPLTVAEQIWDRALSESEEDSDENTEFMSV